MIPLLAQEGEDIDLEVPAAFGARLPIIPHILVVQVFLQKILNPLHTIINKNSEESRHRNYKIDDQSNKIRLTQNRDTLIRTSDSVYKALKCSKKLCVDQYTKQTYRNRKAQKKYQWDLTSDTTSIHMQSEKNIVINKQCVTKASEIELSSQQPKRTSRKGIFNNKHPDQFSEQRHSLGSTTCSGW